MVRDGACAPPHHEGPLAAYEDLILRSAHRARHEGSATTRTPDTRPHSRSRHCPSFAARNDPQLRGRREGRVSATPMAPVRKKCTGQEPQVKPEHPGLPCAVVYGFLRALPGDQTFVVTVACVMRKHRRDLAPALGRQDHTTSPSASSAVRLQAASRPPHPALNVRDDAYAPLVSTGPAKHAADLGFRQSGIFFAAGLDWPIPLEAACEIRFLAQREFRV